MIDTAVLDERAAIEREIAGVTICDQLERTAERYPDAPAYSDPDGDGETAAGGTAAGG